MPEIELRAAVIELSIKNYLSNAIKYHDPAKPDRFIDISAEQCRTDTDGWEVIIRVRDNGIGVPAELLPRLFDLFTQQPRELHRAEGGLGLG